MEATKNEMQTKKIIFFDGVCHLCNAFVDHLIQRDQQHKLFFAPLQGVTASQLLPAEQTKQLNSVIYSREGLILQESQAVIQVLQDLGGLYKFFVIFRIIPSGLRDGIYRWVAKNRYAWFGERDFCRIATAEERSFLLP